MLTLSSPLYGGGRRSAFSRRDAREFGKPQCQTAPVPVTTGLDPVVHAELQQRKLSGTFVAAWIAGSSPAMTK
jgi:hypothetical protein